MYHHFISMDEYFFFSERCKFEAINVEKNFLSLYKKNSMKARVVNGGVDRQMRGCGSPADPPN